MDTLDLVERVLKKFGDGMDIAELVARMSLTGELTSKATNLKKTVSVLIYRDIKLKGEASRFCIPTRGKFALRQVAAEPVAAPKPQSEPNDIGYFYILVNDSFSNTWVKILTSYKPIAPDGDEINDPSVPLPYAVFSAYKTRRFTSARTAFFGLLIEDEKKVAQEPHEGFFRVCATRAHQLMASVAESFGESDGIYVAALQSRKFELRNPHPPPADGSTEIYVGNLPYDMTDSGLVELFSPHGDVTEARVVVNRFNGKSKGFGFVRMKERSAAESACAALNGRTFGDRAIRVNIAKNVTKDPSAWSAGAE